MNKSRSNTMKFSKSNITVFIILVIAVSCSLLSFCASASNASSFMDLELSIKELEQIVEKASPGVVMVVSYDDSGAESRRGSGFFIDREGRIITNASIMKDAYSAEVLSRSNHYDDVIILNRDETLDFALIQVKATGEAPLELDFDYKIEPGERVVAIGRSSDLKKTVSEGIIISLDNTGEISGLIDLQTTTPILSFRKSKDGPLLNMSGKVIGVTSTAIADNQNFDEIPRMPDYQNIKAISLDSIKPFLSKPDSTEHLQRAKSKIWSRWFLRWLKTAAVTGFITLYGIGFSKLMAIVFIIIVIISIIQWLYFKLKKGIISK